MNERIVAQFFWQFLNCSNNQLSHSAQICLQDFYTVTVTTVYEGESVSPRLGGGGVVARSFFLPWDTA